MQLPIPARDTYASGTNVVRERGAGAHDDVIKWKPLLRYWPFVRGIHRLPVISQVNNGEAGDLRRCRAHYDVIVMC